jgi:hypothetical protein
MVPSDTIRQVHTFFLGHHAIDPRVSTEPQVYNFINGTDPRLRAFLKEHDTGPSRYDFSYYPRAYRHDSKLYAIYIHFDDATLAAAFKLMWHGEPASQNY